jgi:hypothetical protein
MFRWPLQFVFEYNPWTLVKFWDEEKVWRRILDTTHIFWKKYVDSSPEPEELLTENGLKNRTVGYCYRIELLQARRSARCQSRIEWWSFQLPSIDGRSMRETERADYIDSAIDCEILWTWAVPARVSSNVRAGFLIFRWSLAIRLISNRPF